MTSYHKYVKYKTKYNKLSNKLFNELFGGNKLIRGNDITNLSKKYKHDLTIIPKEDIAQIIPTNVNIKTLIKKDVLNHPDIEFYACNNLLHKYKIKHSEDVKHFFTTMRNMIVDAKNIKILDSLKKFKKKFNMIQYVKLNDMLNTEQKHYLDEFINKASKNKIDENIINYAKSKISDGNKHMKVGSDFEELIKYYISFTIFDMLEKSNYQDIKNVIVLHGVVIQCNNKYIEVDYLAYDKNTKEILYVFEAKLNIRQIPKAYKQLLVRYECMKNKIMIINDNDEEISLTLTKSFNDTFYIITSFNKENALINSIETTLYAKYLDFIIRIHAQHQNNLKLMNKLKQKLINKLKNIVNDPTKLNTVKKTFDKIPNNIIVVKIC